MPSSISLIIKGNSAIAEHETAFRNLGPTIIRGQVLGGQYTVAFIPATMQNQSIVQDWFLNPPIDSPPYPVGTLLHYSTHSGEETSP